MGVGAVLPDAPNVAAFWKNVKNGRYSISEVTPDRWDPALYYDSDHSAPDKTYSKIGGWVREHVWEPMKWRLPIPPRVVDAMDESQKWAIACTREALEDYGYPEAAAGQRSHGCDPWQRHGGEKHYFTALRLYFPEYAHELAESASFAALPETVRRDIIRELHDRMAKRIPDVTEDTMPGELANCIAGRIANVFNFHGPNYVVDAACASAMAAISAAVEGLVAKDFDIAVTGGIDRNMGASTYIKFCKIGALSATGTRPYAEGADGFVMGEGTAIFLLKRLADAERDGDKIYAVLRGMAGSSDGKGKGITAPNPIGQKLAIERAWQNAGLSPATVTLIEGHGTSTAVGDVVEAQSMIDVLSSSQLPAALGGAGFGQIELRAPQRSGRRCRTAESHPVASGQSTAAERALRASQSKHRLCTLSALRQYRAETVDDAGRWRAPSRSERFWFWRHQFPRCARRVHSWQAERKWQALGCGQRDTVEGERANSNDACGRCFPHV